MLTGRRSGGANSPFWRGGVSPENRRIRYSAEMKRWRIAVFTRDNYMCWRCGDRSQQGNPVHLHAHHIEPFASNPELRFTVSNGLTFCKECHYAVHREMATA